jgi:hypothetical protein
MCINSSLRGEGLWQCFPSPWGEGVGDEGESTSMFKLGEVQVQRKSGKLKATLSIRSNLILNRDIA